MELEKAYKTIKAEGAEVIAISVDTMSDTKLMADLVSASYPILSDEAHVVTEKYGLFNLLGDGVSAPGTYVITSDKRIRLVHVGQSIGDRVSTRAIVNGIRELKGKTPLPDGKPL